MPDPIPNSTEQVVTAQDHSAVAQPVQAQAQGGAGPWAAKLAANFADESTRAQVDAFLRSEVQPYVTSVEQRAQTYQSQAKLYQNLEDAPAETYLAITEKLFGDEAVDRVIDLLVGSESPADEDTTPVTDARDPEVDAMLDDWKSAKRREGYDAELARIKGIEGNEDIDDVMFHPFVVSADGDFDQAVQAYHQWESRWRPAPMNEELPADPPPNALGSDTSTTTAPPTQQHFNSVDDALDAFFDELKASPPPVVGGV